MIVELNAPTTPEIIEDVRFAADLTIEDVPLIVVNGVTFAPHSARAEVLGLFVTYTPRG